MILVASAAPTVVTGGPDGGPAGCPVVLKPAEDTPLVARLFARLVDEAGFPAGVFNLVTGTGAVAGAALAAHPEVDVVSFTGSTAVGRQVAETAGRGLKRVALELGGKSANVVLPGADLARAVNVNVANVFANSGQTCSAWTRLLVHRDQYEEVVALAAKAAEKYVPGDPTDPQTRIGPLINAKQLARVRGYLEGALAQGARLLAGGPDPLAPFGGYKGSGLGRELGRHGLEEFLQYKSLQY